jgi:cobalt-zinc-cadmium efflux system outer membrane protein
MAVSNSALKLLTAAILDDRFTRLLRASCRASATFVICLCVSTSALGQDQARVATIGIEQLTLERAWKLMLEHNRDLRAAQRAVEASQAAILTASARPNPNLTLQTSNINPQVGIGPGGLRDKAFDTQFRVDSLIERGSKRDLRMATAADLERASREDLVDSIRAQRISIAGAYYDLRLAQERLAITRETAALYQSTLAASRQRLKAGDIATTDVTRITIDALRAKTDVDAAELDRRRTQLALATLLGIDAEAPRVVAVDDWPTGSGTTSPDELSAIVTRRPDVLAAQARFEAADSARQLARSLRVRDVTFAVTYDHWPTNGNNFQGTGNSYGVSVSVPLFLGNSYDGEIARAEVDWYSARDALDKATALAMDDLARSRLELDAARERSARFDQEFMDAGRSVAEAQEFAYRKGAIGVLDLLDARRTLRTIQLDAAGARADYAKALATFTEARNTSPTDRP